jgi:putative zinc finger/helix-turn-helix YgiT family protein
MGDKQKGNKNIFTPIQKNGGEMKEHCPRCKKIEEVVVGEKEETFPIKEDKITITSQIAYCKKCKQEVFSEKLDGENIRKVYDIYRSKHNILSPNQIKELREKYGLSQRALAEFLGWGEVTIHRYEKGSLPDEVHNELLSLLSTPENMLKIYEQKEKQLSERLKVSLKKRINGLLNDNSVSKLTQIFIGETEATEFTGYKKFNLQKMIEIILYILNGKKEYKTKINKLLWYIDFLNFKKQVRSITGSSYINLKYGPTPDSYGFIFELMIKEEFIDTEEVFLKEGEPREIFKSFKKCSKEIFSRSEREIIDFVIEYFKNYSAAAITEKSHKEIPYKNTKRRHKISYDLAEKLSIDLPS